MPAFGEHLRRFYPGLVPREEALWRAWLREHEDEFDRFEYNVHVGRGVRLPPGASERDDDLAAAYRAMFESATQLKIDCVGYRGRDTWIFEVEERASSRALGQVLTYAELLPRTREGVGHTELAVVAARLGTDMSEVYDEFGVLVFVVTPAA